MPSSTTFISQPSTMSSAYGTYVLSYFDSNMMDPSNSEGRIQTSVTVFLITLAASEVVIYTICKIMAWYAHVTFYAQGDMNWIHETTTDPSINSQDPSIPSTDTTDTADSHDPSWNDIQNALFTSMYNTAATTKERLFIPIPAPVQAPVLVPLSSNNDDDEGDDNDDDHTCPICLNDFELGDLLSNGSTCHHRFHNQCLSEWLSKQTTCPCCRSTMMTTVPSKQPSIEVTPQTSEQRLSWVMRYRDPSLDPAFCLFMF